MPLSEHEQRLLEQMERALYAEDPKFASALRGSGARAHFRRRVVLGGVGFVLGIALLLTGVIVKVPVVNVVVSVAGFVLMLGSAFFALSSWRQIPSGDARADSVTPIRAGRRPRAPRGGGRRQRGGQGSFMQRVEQRWSQRRDRDAG